MMRLPALHTASSSARIGFVESLEGGVLRGWAYDASVPGCPPRIRITRPNTAPVEIVADRYRADVQLAGYGNGFCGFAYPLGSSFVGDITCCWAEDGSPLGGGPWPPKRPAALQSRIGSLVAGLDWPVRGSLALTGFLVDTTSPHRRLSAALHLGGLEAQRARACRYAADSLQHGSDGFHGFRLDCARQAVAKGGVEIREPGSGRILFRLDRRWQRAAGLA